MNGCHMPKASLFRSPSLSEQASKSGEGQPLFLHRTTTTSAHPATASFNPQLSQRRPQQHLCRRGVPRHGDGNALQAQVSEERHRCRNSAFAGLCAGGIFSTAGARRGVPKALRRLAAAPLPQMLCARWGARNGEQEHAGVCYESPPCSVSQNHFCVATSVLTAVCPKPRPWFSSML